MYRKLLIALDGSPSSEHALGRALVIAKTQGAALIAVYVQRLPEAPTLRIEVEHRMARTEDEDRVLLHHAVQRAKEEGVDIQAELLYGHPADQILRAAEQHGVDLIVTGRRGRSGIHRFRMGSVSEAVSRHAEVDVLIVKAERE